MSNTHAGAGSPTSSEPRRCRWCDGPVLLKRRDAEFCGRQCRQWAFRFRRRRATAHRFGAPMRFAYADPPYPGTARRYYSDQPSFAGEVDHAALIACLVARSAHKEAGVQSARVLDGWALSTSAKALRDVLPLCPPHARVCAWVKPHGAVPISRGLHNVWEPLIVVGGRQRPPGKQDTLIAHAARRGGTLPGRKPIAFCAWLFDCLGMQAGDELEDLFPGTGIVGRAWREVSSCCRDDASQGSRGDASLATSRDASPRTSRDASLAAACNASLSPADDVSRKAG